MAEDNELRIDFRFREVGTGEVAAAARRLNAELAGLQQTGAKWQDSLGKISPAIVAELNRQAQAVKATGEALGLATRGQAEYNANLEAGARSTVQFGRNQREVAASIAAGTRALRDQGRMAVETSNEVAASMRATERFIARTQAATYGGHELSTSQILSARNRMAAATAAAEQAAEAEISRRQRQASRLMAQMQREEMERQRFASSIAPQTRVEYRTNREGELQAVAAGVGGVGAASGVAAREARHFVALFDEFKRGNFGAMFSTVGAAIRDAGVATSTLVAGVGVLIGASVVTGFMHMASRVTEMTQALRNSAMAAGVSIEQFSRLQNVMQMAGGSSKNVDRSLEGLTARLEEAVHQPFGAARGGFAAMGFSREDLEKGLQEPIQFLEIMRQKFQELPATGARTQAFVAALSREFRELAPFLTMSAQELVRFEAASRRAGEMSGSTAQDLARAAEKSREFDLSVQNLQRNMTLLVTNTGVDSWLNREIQGLADAAWGWSELAKNMERVTSIRETINKYLPAGGAFLPLTGLLPTAMALGMGGGSGATGASATLPPATQNDIGLTGIAAKVAQYESKFRPNIGFGEVDLTGRPLDKFGFPQWEGRRDPESGKISHAAGLFQFEPKTWERYAAPLGVKDFSVESQTQVFHAAHAAEGMVPWQSNKALMADLGGASGGAGKTSEGLDPLRKARESYDYEMLQIENKTKLELSKYGEKVSQAGHNQDLISQIEADRAKFLAGQAEEEKKVKDKFGAAAKASGATDAEIAKYTDPTSSQVKAIDAQTQLNNAERRAKDEKFREAEQDAHEQVTQAKMAADEVIKSTSATAEQKIAAERQAAEKIQAIYSDLASKTKDIYAQDEATYKRIISERVSAERQAANEVASLRKQGLETDLHNAERAQQTMGIAARGTELLAQGQGLMGKNAGMTSTESGPGQIATLQAHASQIQSMADQIIAKYQEVADKAGKGSEIAVQAEEKILQVRTQALQEEIQDFQKAQQVMKSMSSEFTNFFKGLGSAFETGMNGIVKALLNPQTEVIHAGLTTMRRTHQGQEIRQAVGQMLISGVQEAAKSAQHAVSEFLGNMLAKSVGVGGGDLGSVIGNWITKQITGSAPEAASFGITAANLQAFNAALVTATGTLGGHAAATGTSASATALNTAATTTNTVATASDSVAVEANAAAQSTSGAGGIFSFLMKMLPIPFFSQGGIVPSAAGGMIVGGAGGTLAMLHEQEMVLPKNLSNGIQGMISNSRSAYNNSMSYSPNVNVRGGGISSAQMRSILISHSGQLMGEWRDMMRRTGRRA